MSIFDDKQIDFTEEPLFYGSGRNISRSDLNEEPFIDKLIDRHWSQIWFPHDFTYVQDATDYKNMSENRRLFFLKNLKFQTLLDSAAARGIAETLLPVTTNPTLERWWYVHGVFENAIHAKSYGDIVKAIGIDSSEVFDDIMKNEAILKRGEDIVDTFNQMHLVASNWNQNQITSNHKKEVLIKTLFMLNILENILFKTSFVCSFAFAENGVMEGSAKCLQKISIDEILHYTLTIYLIKKLRKYEEYKHIFEVVDPWAEEMYERAYIGDLEWIDYLYKSDPALIGLTKESLKNYSLYNISQTMKSVGLKPISNIDENPLPWVKKYMNTSNIQTALNETDGINYLVGIIDKDIKEW